MSSRCKSCDATIIWAITDHGKSMPVDSQPSSSGNVELRFDKGVYRATVHAGPNGRSSGGFYTSHFVTCPHASKHRKARGA